MSGVESDAMQAEFGVLATWTADAVRILGPEYAIPAACKGSASPAVLEWLARGLRPDSVLADVGGGMGGPAAYAAGHFGVRPIVLEPMVAACRAATRLFGVPALACDGAELPVADQSMDAVWCLGVLCTVQDKDGLLGECARVLKPGGSLGLLVFTSEEPRPEGAPEGNVFPAEADLPGLLGKQGFEIIETASTSDLPDTDAWKHRAEEVEALVGQLHAGDPLLDDALDQESRIGRLIRDGVVRGTLVRANSR